MSRGTLFISLLLILTLLFPAPGAKAQLEEQQIPEREKVVFSYFKLTRTQPNYEHWVKNSNLYRSQPAKIREEVLESEKLRLRWNFGTYDVKKDFIKITADVFLQMRNTKKDGTTLNFRFINPINEDVPYFPFPYGDQGIALVVNDLGAFTSIALSKEDAARIAAFMPMNKVFKGQVTFRIKPVSADATKPLQLEGIDQWLLLGETALVKFVLPPGKGGKETVVWEYTAPWYLTSTEKLLLPLLSGE